jgi:biotin transport system ATP-binding protein
LQHKKDVRIVQIHFDQASVRFDAHVALESLTLSLNQHRIGVIGLNGSGKSTFARLINGLVKPSSGRVTLDGLDTVKDAKAVLSRTGFIFQNPANQIILPLIGDDIAMGPKARGLKGAALEAALAPVVERLGIAPLLTRRPHELSGGELQLAALAAVLVTKPKLVIFDEPTNQLDLKNRALVARTIHALEEQALVISHDLELVAEFERVLVFDQAKLVFDGNAIDAIAFYRELATC